MITYVKLLRRRRSVIDVTKTIGVANWKPLVTFKKGLFQAIDGYLQNTV